MDSFLERGIMKYLYLLAIIGVCFFAMGNTNFANSQNFKTSFVEDNDLWMEDDINSKAGITKEMFNKVVAMGLEIYKPIATENNEKLTINPNWSDSTVNADCSRYYGRVTVNMYGGLARRSEVTPEGFALVLCHELGHAYGGIPYINKGQDDLSAEGQSDYYGAKDCLRKILPKLEMPAVTATAYTERRCQELGTQDSIEYKLCIRQLDAAMSLGKLLAVLKEEPIPSFETPDLTVVEETETSYPATTQCRMDTYHNGSLMLERPRCWFKD